MKTPLTLYLNPQAMTTTLRIVNKHRENGGEWFCEPDNADRLAYVQKELLAMQQAEPNHGWKLECRGQQSQWHDYKP